MNDQTGGTIGADFAAVLDRLAAALNRSEGRSADPAAGIELDADKVKPGKPAEVTADGAGANWQRVGDILAAATAKAVANAVERIRGDGKDREPDPSGGTVPTGQSGGKAAPAAAGAVVGGWLARTRAGRAVRDGAQRVKGSRVGRVAMGVGGAVAGSRLGRMVGSFGGPVGMAAGAIAGGIVGGIAGRKAAGPGAGAKRGTIAGGATGALVGGALGGPAGALGGAAAGAALGAAAGLATKGLAGLKDQVEKTTDQLRTYHARLGEYSGQMSIALTRRAVQEMNRDREIGDRLAPSAGKLYESEKFRKDNTKELEILGGRIENGLTSLGNYVVGGLHSGFNEIAGLINEGLGDSKMPKATLGAAGIDPKGEMEKAQQAAKNRMGMAEIAAAWGDLLLPGPGQFERVKPQ